MYMNYDVVIVGTGAAGLFSAINLPDSLNIAIVTKEDAGSSDSFLAQGGICVKRGDDDYESFFEDTMRAGHYKNRRESVDIMINSSADIINDLEMLGVKFEKENGKYVYTREGAHSKPRILFHEDITGKEITGKLLDRVKSLKNVTIFEYMEMIDIIEESESCKGIIVRKNGEKYELRAKFTLLACGGIGGLYEHSTNYPHMTGDAVRIAKNHGIRLQDLDYVQFHPTTLYSDEPGRRFLISESVRGEGARLYNKAGERFVDELLPRDAVTEAIRKEMVKDGTNYVMLSMEDIKKETILKHFPNIYKHCLEKGFDVTKESIPVVPAQHYFMGGIWVDSMSRTSMDRLYAAGETSCSGVHGANRLASNSLLESLVFSKRAAKDIYEKICGESKRKSILKRTNYEG